MKDFGSTVREFLKGKCHGVRILSLMVLVMVFAFACSSLPAPPDHVPPAVKDRIRQEMALRNWDNYIVRSLESEGGSWVAWVEREPARPGDHIRLTISPDGKLMKSMPGM
jgi:hypothetical protein